MPRDLRFKALLVTAVLNAASLLPLASAEAASAYRVTVQARPATLQVSQFQTLQGVVSPRAPGQAVLLQRLAGGVWRTVATAQLSRSSAYIFRYRETAAGHLRFRVWKPASGRVGAGHSAAAVANVLNWHYLADLQTISDSGWVLFGPYGIDGVTYVHSIDIQSCGIGCNGISTTDHVEYSLRRGCLRLAAVVGQSDANPGGQTDHAELLRDGALVRSLDFGAAATLNVPVDGVLRLRLTALYLGDDFAYSGTVFGNARVNCYW